MNTTSPVPQSSRSPQRQTHRAAALLGAAAVFTVLLLLGSMIPLATPAQAQGGALTVTINAGYNLVVDSNVSSPSTYAPRVATVIGKFCNTGNAPLTNVYGYIGNGTTPGTYPARNSLTDAEFQSGQKWNYLYNTGSYAYRHVGPASDAARYIGTLAPGECSYQYWTIEYPACENVGGAWAEPPCSGDPLWGTSVKPDDDFSLQFIIWGTSDQSSDGATWTMTMRNEISAMANKIEPNGNPPGQWFNTENDTVRVGDVITTNGVLYSLGNVRFGFDNDVDWVPDYNAWVQPISQVDFDPSCFRLIRTSGVLTITRGGGNPPLILPFKESLYFTNLPPDNTNVRGEVYYTFLALKGPCTIGLTPYQEVASGYDNEKFNGDYGTSVPSPQSLEPEVTITKSSNPSTVLVGGTTTYRIPFANAGTAPAGLTLSSGGGVNMPLVVSDTVPNGMQLAAAATYQLNFSPNSGVTIRYSTNSGATWSSTAPVGSTSTWPNNKIIIQWWLNDPLPAGSTGNYAQFQATVPSGYSGTSFIANTACVGFGEAAPFACGTDILLVQGDNSIGDRVWADTDSDGVQDTGETGITGVTVSLYWDKNGDGKLDDGDVLITSMETGANGAYSFPNLPDGNYIVAVDSNDADIPAGYTNTTAGVLAVPLDPGGTNLSPVNVTWADFGFGPALTLDKTLTSANPAYEGESVTFNLTVKNNLPGGPSNDEGFCTYHIWAGHNHPYAGTDIPKSANNAWQNEPYALNAPDNQYATLQLNSNSDDLGLGAFDTTPQSGLITRVELVVYAREYVDFKGTTQKDQLVIQPYYNNIGLSSQTYDSSYFTLTAPANYVIVRDITSLRAWQWSDFASDQVELLIQGRKGNQSPYGQVGVDAVAYRITTNQTCGGRDSTITLLPLTDRYDASKLKFVSASPVAPDSVTTGGSSPYPHTGTLSWSNVGPLAAGQTRTIQVTFRALEPPGNLQTTTTNYAHVSGAAFGNGRSVNDASDDAPVTINPTGSIGDTIWNDNGLGSGTSGNGVQDGGELGIPGVTVYLDRWNGSAWVLHATQVTDGGGKYLFDGLRDGQYRVRVDTGSLPGSTFTQTGDPDATLDNQTTVNISGANDVLTADFGYLIPNTIYGNVWRDWDGDGNVDTGDNGISGVTVYLYDNNNQLVATTTTDANGNYVFSDRSDGSYYVVVNNTASPLGADWSNTVDPEGKPGNHQSNLIAVSGGNVYGSYDFGYHRTGAYELSGKVYADWNANNDWNTGEPGFRGIPVTLYSSTGAVIATTLTDANGNYSFGNLPPGDYTIVVDQSALPPQYTQTEDPDSTRDGRTTVTITTSSLTNLDFGYKPDGYGSIGDTVWRDDNGNGLQGATEPGLNNITVWLYVDYGDGNGYQRVKEMSTANGGQYLFENLPPGNYRVMVDTQDPQLPTDGYGNRYVPSTSSFFDVTLDAGETYLDADFSFTVGAVVGDRVWRDNNGNGNQDLGEPGLSGVTVGLYTWTDTNHNGYYDAGDTLSATPLATDVTASDGLYLFTGLPAGNYVVQVDGGIPSGYRQSGDPDWLEPCTGSSLCDGASGVTLRAGQIDLSRDFGYIPPGVIGDYVWFDSNDDGVQDAGEQGIGYATVYLDKWDGSNWLLNATTATDSDGYYSFGNLGAGTYRVRVDTSTLPAGVAATYDRDDGTTSPNSIVTDIVVNDSGQVTSVNGVSCTDCNMEMDFGYRYSGDYTISGTVFYDDDDDGGLYDAGAGDLPYGNVTVYLWNSAGMLIGSTKTDANGFYSFPSLPNGDYTVSVDRNSTQLADMTWKTPATGKAYYQPVTINNGDQPNKDFGLHSNMDFDDLPSVYRTTVADEGPRHVIGSLYLGASVTQEGDGRPSAAANLDTDNGIVRKSGESWTAGSTVHLYATVTGSHGYLVGWFDWNNDGDFADPNEKYTFGSLAAGSHEVAVSIPLGANPGDTVYARFRLYEGKPVSADPSGLAINGEVEGYRWSFGVITNVTLVSFTAVGHGHGILVAWETALELNTLGFNIYRAESPNGPWTRLNGELIASQAGSSMIGAAYTFQDESAAPGVTYYYWLESVTTEGRGALYGPISASLSAGGEYRLYLPLINQQPQ